VRRLCDEALILGKVECHERGPYGAL
jgi:hypothetical protein